jgi:predicted membrane channel-forming protein YqfA (hemolysin III family)
MAFLEEVSNWFSISFNSSQALNVFLFALFLAAVSLFIFEFYKSTSKKNLISLNLSKYNKSEHPLMSKIAAIWLYLLEYAIIMPILIILWFAALAAVLLLMTERPITEILFISAAFITAVRILAYFNEEISQEMAKLFPFIALSIYLLSPGALRISEVLAQAENLPLLINNAFSYIAVVFSVEIVSRFTYSLHEFWRSEEEVT